MSKEKHGEFIEVCWEWEPECYAVRGHVNLDTFNDAIGGYGCEEVDSVEHVYWRAVPDRTGQWDMRYVFDVKSGAGAFKRMCPMTKKTGERCIEEVVVGWYEENIEPEVRELVRYLRNNGINTECSCGHDNYVQCQYIPDGTIQALHILLFNYFTEQSLPVSYTIDVRVMVVDGYQYATLDVRLGERAKA